MQDSPQTTPSWVRAALGLGCVAAVILAVVVVGPATSAPQVNRRVITVEKGVVQSTVSASGSLQPARELNVNFKAGGTLLAVDVRAGQHVYDGQLLAELDPQSATVAVEQAQAGVAAAEAKLAQVESDPTTTASAAVATTAKAAASTTPISRSTPTPTTPTTTSPAQATAPSATSKQQTTTPATTTDSPATRAANIASAKAALAGAQLSLKSAQIGLANTKLYAPASGTIATLSDAQPGDSISAGATGAAAQSSAGGTGTGSGTSTGNGSASSSGASSSSAFIVLVDLSGMDLVVPLSESDITKVRPGQAASVTVNALSGSNFAAHVTSVATLPSTSSGVVSYDVTLHLNQLQFGLKPGMTAAAQIVVSQAQGAVSLPSAAISRAGGQTSVTVVKGGKDVVQPVVTGIVGDSATQVVSGLTGGEQVVISTSTSLGTSATGGAAAGAGGFGGGGGARLLGGAGGGGGAVAFGGGGGAGRRGGG